MSAWRVIITDTESLTGVAPACESPEHAKQAEQRGHNDPQNAGDWVFDCCPHPHIETWSESVAEIVAARLTMTDAEPCS